MTIDEAINNFTEATKNHREEQQYWLNERDETSPLYEADRFSLADDSRESAEYYEQLAEWLKELKALREENKVLMQECDRLIKEKGELLSKVSGGDVLRICQLEEQLEKAKRLLKVAVEDFSEMKPCLSEPYSHLCDKWRYADEALKLIES